MPIQHISDTARWVAYYRAMETERPDAIFRDPFASRLAGPAGEEIVDGLRQGRSIAWAMIVRTAVFDELIMDRVTRHGADMVLNLAAGLDARPWRLPLPGTVRWVDVDLPGILEYKTSLMKDERPGCRYETVAADLTQADARSELVSRLGAEASRVLVVTEGLLIYLTEPQVTGLAEALHRPASFRWWLIDLISPQLLKMINRNLGKSLEQGRAPFHFAPEQSIGFFRPLGWREEVFRSSGEEAHRLHREMRLGWLWRFIGRFMSAEKQEQFRRMSSMVLLSRDP
jgi:methyltransferase (TIGR00027 family)